MLGIVEQSGGHIDVTSEVGHGTTFLVYLPRAGRARAGRRGRARRGAGQPAGGRETILLAEDEDSVRRLARTDPRAAAGTGSSPPRTGWPRWRRRAAHHGAIDLLLTDVIMPGGNGRELASALRGRAIRSARVLFMSGYAGEALSAQGVLEPSVAFLAKPFVPAELVRKVREVLDEASAG